MKCFLLILALFSFAAEAKLKVVTTTSDLASLVNEIGKEKIEIFSIGKGTQDPHQIEAKPSFIVKMRGADLVLAQGLELETAWIDPLIRGARNPSIQAGSRGFFELGPLLEPIDSASGKLTRAAGDVHPGGNPHFQLDPIRLANAALLIAARLGELDPPNKDFYSVNAKKFQKLMEDKTKEWKSRLEKTEVKEIITHHKTFTYFLDRFGIKNSLQLEPKPGIPPTASHLIEVIQAMKTRGIKLALIENYFDGSAGDKIKKQVPGVEVRLAAVSVGGEPGIQNNEALLENLVKIFESVKP